MDETRFANSPLLRALPDGAREALLARGRRTLLPEGLTIFAQGEPGETLLVIETGRVEVSLVSAGGRRAVLDHMGPGEVVGELALLDRGARSADVIAVTDVVAIEITRAVIAETLASEPGAALSLIAEICAKARNASEMFEAKSEIAAEARLAACVLRLARKWGRARGDGAVELTEPFSQTELGDFAGLARENANRHLRAWAERGLVAYTAGRDRRLVLLRVDALEAIAGG